MSSKVKKLKRTERDLHNDARALLNEIRRHKDILDVRSHKLLKKVALDVKKLAKSDGFLDVLKKSEERNTETRRKADLQALRNLLLKLYAIDENTKIPPSDLLKIKNYVNEIIAFLEEELKFYNARYGSLNQSKTKSNKGLLIVLAIGLILLLAGGGSLLGILGSDNSDDDTDTDIKTNSNTKNTQAQSKVQDFLKNQEPDAGSLPIDNTAKENLKQIQGLDESELKTAGDVLVKQANRKQFGAACTNSQECGFLCVNRKCTGGTMGEICAKNWHCSNGPIIKNKNPLNIKEIDRFCSSGNFCTSGREDSPCLKDKDCLDAGTCVNKKCTGSGTLGLGEKCKPPSTFEYKRCRPGMICKIEIDAYFGQCVKEKQAGVACTAHAECGQGMRCLIGTCQDTKKPGEKCIDTFECSKGLTCNENCIKPNQIGGSCKEDSHCAPKRTSSLEIKIYNFCVLGKCQGLSSVGGTCSAQEHCKKVSTEEVYCNPDTHQCTLRGKKGTSCNKNGDCGTELTCINGACTSEAGSEGGSCSESVCQYGLFCNSDKKCEAEHSTHASCDKDDACKTGVCLNKFCKDKRENGESCQKSNHCIVGICNEQKICADVD